MLKIYHFFRLIRFANLMVIGLTMGVIEFFILKYELLMVTKGSESGIGVQANQISGFSFVFILFIFSTVLIAGAGNIINDYFDIKADRVNKPKRLIIDKYIKRRWAMVFHWSFNSLGLLIALYIGYILQNIWVPLIAFVSINILWFYSVYFKRKALLGNLMVSLLLGIVPIYVWIFNLTIVFENTSDNFVLSVVAAVSGIAFLMNLVRELVKDIQDVRGDLRLNAKTFPIKYGVKITKWLIGVVSILGLCLISAYIYLIFIAKVVLSLFGTENNIDLNAFIFLIFGTFILFLGATFITLFAKKIKTYKLASTLLKVAMLFGLLTPLFL